MTVFETDFTPIGDLPAQVDFRAATVLMRDMRGRILLQLRDSFPGVPSGGKWALFGGQVEPGEDLVTTAIREIGEELSVALDPASLTPLAVFKATAMKNAVLYTFACNTPVEPHRISLREGAGFGFFEPHQLGDIPVVVTLKPVLDHYFEVMADLPTEPDEDRV